MKTRILLITVVFVSMIFNFGCQKKDIGLAPGSSGPSKPVVETPNTMPPSIMVDGEVYSITGKQLPIEPDESVIQTTTSVIKGTELPSNEGEINFPIQDTKYVKINDVEEYVVVLIDSEWVRFNKRGYLGSDIKYH